MTGPMIALAFAGGTFAIGLVCGFIALLDRVIDRATDGRA